MDWHEYFYYDATGLLFWKAGRKNEFYIAGNLSDVGYIQVKVSGGFYRYHRIIWEMHFGKIPKGMLIDHIDGDKLNNKIENLRLATNQQNSQNARIKKSNRSGVKGVCWNKKQRKWYATIYVDGKQKFLGSYQDIEDAKHVIMKAREKFHGEFANHGFES